MVYGLVHIFPTGVSLTSVFVDRVALLRHNDGIKTINVLFSYTGFLHHLVRLCETGGLWSVRTARMPSLSLKSFVCFRKSHIFYTSIWALTSFLHSCWSRYSYSTWTAAGLCNQSLRFNYKDLPDCWQFREKTNAKVTHYLHPPRFLFAMIYTIYFFFGYGKWCQLQLSDV